ncbi:hypothetical protein EIP86_008848 [Pleurotus ostreatoroseus]|nr:hypothetical protein EIP86_008848 [Pleurotus ostreatoroseus]
MTENIRRMQDEWIAVAGLEQTLRACARTCRSWAPRAQKYLYRTVVIKQGGPDPYTLRFSPAVLAHIRHVVVHGDLCGEIIHSVLSGRTDVTRLDLRNNPRQGSYTVSRAELPSLPGLRTLSLRWVFFRTGRDMLESLSKYRCLSDLTLDLTNFYYAFVAPNDQLPSIALPIKTLRLKLRSIPVPPDSTYRSRAVLRATGASLERLHIMLDSFAPEPLTRVEQLVAVFESLDLITNTSLRSLDVEFRWTAIHSYSRIRHNIRPRLANALLSQIYSAQLQTLTLRIHLSCLTEGADWQQALDLRILDYLAEPTGDSPMTRAATERALARSAGLKSVTLKLSLEPISSNEAFSRIEAHLKAQLPKFMERRILRIEPWSGTTDDSL